VQANVVVSSVSIGGLAATKIQSDERTMGTDYIRTEQWYAGRFQVPSATGE
jgi:hypothetical protein